MTNKLKKETYEQYLKRIKKEAKKVSKMNRQYTKKKIKW